MYRTALQERHRLGCHFGNGKGRCWRFYGPTPAPACHIIHVITPESNRVFTVGMEWRGRREGASCSSVAILRLSRIAQSPRFEFPVLRTKEIIHRVPVPLGYGPFLVCSRTHPLMQNHKVAASADRKRSWLLRPGPPRKYQRHHFFTFCRSDFRLKAFTQLECGFPTHFSGDWRGLLSP